MALRHRIIGLIWAAVLVIAVQFVPSIASAHSGHEHHTAAGTIHVGTVKQQADQAAARATSKATLAEPTQQDREISTPSGGACTGGCCGIGLGCCGAVLTDSTAPLFHVAGRVRLMELFSDQLGGIGPDTLARPPRPLA
jgi:hypothetical protein